MPLRLFLLGFLSLALSQTPPDLAHGAVLYDLHCSACHGKTGLGFAEAPLAFPEDHRRCTACHKPNNPPVMSMEIITPRHSFSLGVAPALRGGGALEHFPTFEVLLAYTRATMPRPFPASLSDAEYRAITHYVLALHGLGDEALELDAAPARLGIKKED